MSSLEFRLKKIDETRNYLLDEIKHNDLMSKKYKKTNKYLNYVKHLFILVWTVRFISLYWDYELCSRIKNQEKEEQAW